MQKADVGVEITSKPIKVGPNVPLVHTYKVFAGPKTVEALAPYGAEELASYRKNQWFGIPGARWMATTVITPAARRHLPADRVGRRGSSAAARGNYGIAIILLTITVHLSCSRSAASRRWRPRRCRTFSRYPKEIQEKYKDDKEQQTSETFALYKKHGVNPLGGCLPALIQLPIFVGLWQALNNSVAPAARAVPLDQEPRRPRHALPVPVRAAAPSATTSTCCRSWSSR